MANLWYVGAWLAVLGSLTGTMGKVLIRLSELRKQQGASVSAKIALRVGLLMNTVVSPLTDLTAFAFAPQALIAPLGALDVVWNTLVAPCTLGEILTKRLLLGCWLIFAGAAITSLVGPHEDSEYGVKELEGILFRWDVFIYLAVFSMWIAFNLLVLMPRSSAPKGEPWQSGDTLRGMSLAMTAGSLSGNFFCVKAFVEIIQSSIVKESANDWAHWLPYVVLVGIALFGLSGVYFLLKALREYEALFMVAVQEGSLVISGAISGSVVYCDMEDMGTLAICVYWFALFFVVCGILIVAKESKRTRASGEEENEEERDVESKATQASHSSEGEVGASPPPTLEI
jgi:hypothetical protein